MHDKEVTVVIETTMNERGRVNNFISLVQKKLGTQPPVTLDIVI